MAVVPDVIDHSKVAFQCRE